MKEQSKNSVSCDNMGALHTFAKECKRVPASSSNADIRRALREVNRLAINKYSLEHVKEQQDKTSRTEELSLEARPNVECDEMAKDAVRESMTRQLRQKNTRAAIGEGMRIYCRQETNVRPKERPEEANRSSIGEGLPHKQGK